MLQWQWDISEIESTRLGVCLNTEGEKKEEGRIRHNASFSGLYGGWCDFLEKEILQEEALGGGGRTDMIQIENLECKMSKKLLEEGVEYGYRNKGLEFKREVWVRVSVKNRSIGGD